MINLPQIKAQIVEQARRIGIATKESLTQVPHEEMTRRLTACRACPHLVRLPWEMCALMNCSCPVITKLTFQRAHCPDNPPRW